MGVTLSLVSLMRRCSRTACGRPAVATLTYVYAEQTAVLGPLATFAEPHTYDLCHEHATRLTAPQGWEVVRLESDGYAPAPEVDDLLAVVDAVRESPAPPPSVATAAVSALPVPGELRRGHLRVLPGRGEA